MPACKGTSYFTNKKAPEHKMPLPITVGCLLFFLTIHTSQISIWPGTNSSNIMQILQFQFLGCYNFQAPVIIAILWTSLYS